MESPEVRDALHSCRLQRDSRATTGRPTAAAADDCRELAAYHGRARPRASASDLSAQHVRQTLEFVSGQIACAIAAGEVAPELDPHREALRLVCLIDGLVPRLLVGQCTAELALLEVDARLDALWGYDGRYGHEF